MTISMSEPLSPEETGGAFADALTLLRIILTPAIMALIVWRWPDVQISILATALLIIAAVTDILDDIFGGSARNAVRRYGYLDDAADTILMVGVLIAIGFVLWQNDILGWGFALPASFLIGRELLVGLVKGYQLSRFGWPDNPLSNAKGAFAILAICLLVGSPWLTQLLDRLRSGTDKMMEVYSAASPWVWITGQVCLWIAAIFSLLSGYRILTRNLADEIETND